jgi:transglutaminase-like putative cysteine protease
MRRKGTGNLTQIDPRALQKTAVGRTVGDNEGVMLRARLSVAALFVAFCGAVAARNATAPQAPATAPVEVVRSLSDIDVNPDGSFVEADESTLRVLDTRGQRAVQQTTLTYTEGLETLQIISAYTQKANGEKIPVADNQILRGYGATSAPGFEDVKTVTIIFPRLEVGDESALSTLRKQIVPLFAGEFAIRHDFDRSIRTDDVQLALTAPESGPPLKVDAAGVDGGQREEYAGKYRWVWRFHNDAPVTPAIDTVIATNDQPHLIVSSFPSYVAVGRGYADHFAGKSDPTPEIESLADSLTHGINDRRAQAKAIYDWVSANISYVNIVLGAGGFTPHSAADVLALRYGDCKDHVMLLEALLAAKGIASNPALIAAQGPFVLPNVPSAFYFNHLITYLPEFRLFADSTARYAPFGELPLMDVDRPVVLVPSGQISATPNATADQNTSRASLAMKFDSDGTAEGQSRIWMTGSAAIAQRALIDAIPPEREKDLFQLTLGPGSEASIDRGNLRSLDEPFAYSLQYRVPNAANFPGPGAVSTSLSVGPFSAASFVLGLLPPSRDAAYACPSTANSESSRFEFPASVKVTSVPRPVSIAADGLRFDMHYEIADPHTVTGSISLRMDHPRAFCTPEYYNALRPDLVRIAASLHGQILYK